MKKLVFLFLSLLTAGSLFQACDDSKTYAEMLEDEKNAVNKFINDNDIRVISQEEFERDTVTASKAKDGYDEYVAFSNGVYMQIVDRGGKETNEDETEFINKVDTFTDNNIICTRYVEQNMITNDTTCFNVALEGWMDVAEYYKSPLTFRYVENASTAYGIVLAGDFDYDYLWTVANAYGTAIPSGWLIALPYLRNNSHVRLIVPSKMGHNSAQQYVTPFFYDIRKFEKAKS